jgi:hypothetical protein
MPAEGSKVGDESGGGELRKSASTVSKKGASDGGFFSRNQKFPDEDYSLVSLGLFHRDGGFRRLVLGIVEAPAFDKFILVIILLNSVCMAVTNHRNPDAPINSYINVLEYIFLAIFIVECVLKIIAYGFFVGKTAYLKDGWNWLDFVVVVTGLLAIALMYSGIQVGYSVGFIRVFRVMRPLRSLTTVPELKKLVNTVIASIPRLGNVGAMCIFLLTIFGILGVNMWMGILDRRCRTQEQVTWNRDAACWSWPLAESGDVSRPCGGRYQCQDVVEGSYCGNVHLDDLDPDYQPQFPRRIVHKDGKVETFDSDRHAADTYTFCSDSIWDTEEMRNNGDFNYGLTNFNSLPNAIIVVFQCITLEGWVDIMYLAQDAHNDYFAYVYFLALTFVGSFFLINVALAVVWEAFSELN